jgi:hypothetical protein
MMGERRQFAGMCPRQQSGVGLQADLVHSRLLATKRYNIEPVRVKKGFPSCQADFVDSQRTKITYHPQELLPVHMVAIGRQTGLGPAMEACKITFVGNHQSERPGWIQA